MAEAGAWLLACRCGWWPPPAAPSYHPPPPPHACSTKAAKAAGGAAAVNGTTCAAIWRGVWSCGTRRRTASVAVAAAGQLGAECCGRRDGATAASGRAACGVHAAAWRHGNDAAPAAGPPTRCTCCCAGRAAPSWLCCAIVATHWGFWTGRASQRCGCTVHAARPGGW